MARSSKSSENIVEAKVVLVNHEWFVEFAYKDLHHCKPVSSDDAWNFDIEKGMVLVIQVATDLSYTVIKRKRGNKKFVRIST